MSFQLYMNYHFSEGKLLKYEKYIERANEMPITLALPVGERDLCSTS
jgi:hypothetical protein